jgi:hypothetical protein
MNQRLVSILLVEDDVDVMNVKRAFKKIIFVTNFLSRETVSKL